MFRSNKDIRYVVNKLMASFGCHGLVTADSKRYLITYLHQHMSCCKPDQDGYIKNNKSFYMKNNSKIIWL